MKNKEPKMLPTLYLDCECHAREHQIRFSRYEETDGKKYLYISFHLYDSSRFFRRIWRRLKHLFGYKCKYGNWDELIITKRNYQALKDAVLFLEEDDECQCASCKS